ELQVRLDRVEPGLLELVGTKLVEQADAAALLRHVEEHAAILASDLEQGLVELFPAVAAKGVEDVSGQALRVNAHQDVAVPVDLALHEREVVLARQRL